jgi:uncharacterized protein (TIGR02145 family)
MKKLITLILLSTAFISNAQRAMFGGHNNYSAPAGPIQIPSVISAGGRIWMDRNLGATQVAISSTDVASYGDLYQFGRGTDGHEKRAASTTSTLSSGDVPGNAKLIIINNVDGRSTKNDNLWQGLNGINNPCPAGFRLPTETEWIAEQASWSPQNQSGAFASPLKLPMAGYRIFHDGAFDAVGAGGFYWSNTVSGLEARFMRFNSSLIVATGYRSYGFCVRCIKD